MTMLLAMIFRLNQTEVLFATFAIVSSRATMDRIKHYFPTLSTKQLGQLEALYPFYLEWNSKINVISRKDMDHFYEHHVLHSLAIAKYISFVKGTSLLDVGTGGGFPGIPLAILFPDSDFFLVDSIGKKIMVVNQATEALGLNNVKARHARAESVNQQFDYVISRAVAALPDFVAYADRKFHTRNKNARPNGILYLKGGDLSKELDQLNKRWVKQVQPVSQWFSEAYFETKYLVHLY